MTLLKQMKGAMGILGKEPSQKKVVSDKVQMRVDRQEVIDKKIEKLLLAYKKQDEQTLKRASGF